MREILPRPLDREAFRRYGDFENLLQVKGMDAHAGKDNIFMPDLVKLHLDGRTQPSISVARVSSCERVISIVEYHQFTGEGILPLDGDIDIFVGPSSFRMDPEKIEAFRVPKGTFVRLNPGVIHGRQFVVDTPAVNVMILLPERTFGNDCVFAKLEPEQQIKLLT